ncbi:type I DNA topoisomerase, partial [Dokdonella sp.]|uniref:type I DNA topoisomerase n=1 Tax=Dokdonella sp. TaxID=2291710 RepID=UPI003C751D21
MAKNLLIVESPAKAKTINKYLGKDFQVLASYGHVRDLVPKEGAVDPDRDFAMNYELIEKNEKHVDAIVKAAKQADSLYLATDLDREGEAISWHIAEILREKKLLKDKAVHRVVFSEITPRAIKEAVANPRPLSMELVNAQQARRALDYLVGFNLSPVLWRKVQRGLSAGRVQSPALRMIVEREEEIEAFIPREYWTIEADLAHPDQAFTARLFKLNNKKFEQFDLTNASDAHAARDALHKAAQGRLVVGEVQSKERKRRASAPFTTSTLQQEAARKLGYATSRTMRLAQQLYEGIAIGDEGVVGLITYMRTDSVSISDEATAELREVIVREFGRQALPEQPNTYKSKSKNAQEAHEAIRPTSAALTPKRVAAFLSPDHARLYELIWKRTVASQMQHATLNTVSVDFPCGADAAFRATGTTVIDPGFLAVYEEGRDHKADAPGADGGDEDSALLPAMAKGDMPAKKGVDASQHFTQPPPRYSEASLVKRLEELGIGRPSTYASTLQVLKDRAYVRTEKNRFFAEESGRLLTAFLERFFPRYVAYEFTAGMEDELDEVSGGRAEWK